MRQALNGSAPGGKGGVILPARLLALMELRGRRRSPAANTRLLRYRVSRDRQLRLHRLSPWSRHPKVLE